MQQKICKVRIEKFPLDLESMMALIILECWKRSVEWMKECVKTEKKMASITYLKEVG